MRRFFLVCLVVVIVVVADLTHYYAVAFGAGVLVGAVLFVFGAASGGMTPVGLTAPHLLAGTARRPSNPNSGIGCALAAAGIGSSVVTNEHYPAPFRVFYGVCIVAGLVIALILAWRARAASPDS